MQIYNNVNKTIIRLNKIDHSVINALARCSIEIKIQNLS